MQENTIFTLLFKKKESYVGDQQQRISCQYRKYLDLVSKGQDVILRSRHLGSFRLTPVVDDDGVMSEQAFYAKIDHSIKQAEEGKVFRQHEGESASDFVDRLLCIK